MNKKTKGLFIGLLAVIVMMFIFNTILTMSILNSRKISSETSTSTNVVSTTINDDVTKVVKNVEQSVVSVALYQNDRLIGNGSGSIISKSGKEALILTNNHVVDMTSSIKIKVLFYNKKEVEATVLGKDAISDLAVLKVNVDFDVKAIAIGDSNKLQTGESVIAIGSPFSLDFSGTVTKGIISGLNRSIESDSNGDGLADYAMSVIQTDTSINPGNSGGPLINMAGQMIGINTSKISETGFENMGFAIPSTEAMNIVEQLKTKGKVERPKLGISYYPISGLNKYQLAEYNVPSDLTEGILITDVQSGSLASKAGIKKDDVLYKVNDKNIASVSDLTSILYKSKSGDVIKITAYRNGKTIEFKITI